MSPNHNPFFTPRGPLEEDLVAYVASILTPSEREIFLSNADIKSVLNNNELSQQVIINKYFTTTLLKIRSASDKYNFTSLFPYLSDGVNRDIWKVNISVIVKTLQTNNISLKI